MLDERAMAIFEVPNTREGRCVTCSSKRSYTTLCKQLLFQLKYENAPKVAQTCIFQSQRNIPRARRSFLATTCSDPEAEKVRKSREPQSRRTQPSANTPGRPTFSRCLSERCCAVEDSTIACGWWPSSWLALRVGRRFTPTTSTRRMRGRSLTSNPAVTRIQTIQPFFFRTIIDREWWNSTLQSAPM